MMQDEPEPMPEPVEPPPQLDQPEPMAAPQQLDEPMQ